MKELTTKEEEVMRHFWQEGALFVRQLVEMYPEPKPHFNTLSTYVRMLEDKVRRETVGRSQGVSVRVVSGVYVRLGAFKGKPVFSTERVEVGVGTLYVTDKNLYFYSRAQSVRIPYGKIVSFEQFSDGLGFMRDAASAKPQFFINGDGWFLYNLITNLAYRE